jgi:hypothetical protein
MPPIATKLCGARNVAMGQQKTPAPQQKASPFDHFIGQSDKILASGRDRITPARATIIIYRILNCGWPL